VYSYYNLKELAQKFVDGVLQSVNGRYEQWRERWNESVKKQKIQVSNKLSPQFLH